MKEWIIAGIIGWMIGLYNGSYMTERIYQKDAETMVFQQFKHVMNHPNPKIRETVLALLVIADFPELNSGKWAKGGVSNGH